MTIEEMKAKGFQRYTAYIKNLKILIIRTFKRYMKAVIHSAVFLQHNQR